MTNQDKSTLQSNGKPWWEKILDATLNVSPFSSSTSVYGLLVLVLFGTSYTLWLEVQTSHKSSLQREREFSEYVKKRDSEVIELVTRVDQRLFEQKDIVNNIQQLDHKVEELLDN